MTRVYLGLGSNVGDRESHLLAARDSIGTLPGTQLVAFSGIYETAPVGPVSQDHFLNAAAAIDTSLDPFDLLDALRDIEHSSGRTPEDQRVKWGPRTLDLDVLLYGNQLVSSDELVIPHPMMHDRWFVLKPLCDVGPDAVHPLLEMTIADLLKDLEKKKGSDP